MTTGNEIAGRLRKETDRNFTFMHICGTHEAAIARSGLRSLLPAGLKIVMGILIGLLFHFAGRLLSHVGLLNDWPALVSAGGPVVAVAVVAALGLWRAEAR